MSQPNILIAPSILAADFSRLSEEIASIEPYADWIQVDVMDGHFVPNLSFGAPVLDDVETSLPLDIHLMVENPEDRYEEFAKLGVYNITYHTETIDEPEAHSRLISEIRAANVPSVGVALNPETPLDAVLPVLPEVDLLLVMSVHPGFGGQEFIDDVLEKVRAAREAFPELMIQMDGGIDAKTAPKCIEAGANNLVSGSYIFGSDNRQKAIESLKFAS